MGLELLGAGAGAAQGLEQLLTQRRAEELMRQQAMAHALSAIGLHEDRQARLGQQKSQADALAESRRNNDLNRQHSVNLAQMQQIPEGTNFSDADVSRFTNPQTGAAVMGQFGPRTDAGTVPGLMPVDRSQAGADQATPFDAAKLVPAGRIFKGTAQQNEKEAAQQSIDMSRLAAIDKGKQSLEQAAQRLEMQGHVNEANILRATAEAELARARAGAAEKKDNTLVLSQRGKDARAAIEQAGPLTDQVLNMIRKEAPDIEQNPDKYNTPISKLSALYQKGKYKLGFYDETDPRQQLVSLLQPIQAGQYTRSSRSRQMLELALKHMADPGQTLLTQYQRAKELKGIMPEMLEGIVRGEQPVDKNNPLGGSYFDPGKTAAPVENAADPVGIRPPR